LLDFFYNHVMLSRLQFAFTTMFHITWPLLFIGLSIFLVVRESLWLKTKDEDYYHQTRFWTNAAPGDGVSGLGPRLDPAGGACGDFAAGDAPV